jgi:hypothetical protein
LLAYFLCKALPAGDWYQQAIAQQEGEQGFHHC